MLVISLQSFFAGLAASGALTSALRMMTKAAFDKPDHGLRKGVSMCLSFLFDRSLKPCTWKIVNFPFSSVVFAPDFFLHGFAMGNSHPSLYWLRRGTLEVNGYVPINLVHADFCSLGHY